MSTATAPPRATGPRPGLRHVLTSEWTKIRTVKSTYWTAVATLVVSIGLSVLIALAFTSSYDQLKEADKAQFDPAAFGLVGTNFGVLVLAVLGVLVISSEYGTGMIRTSLTAVPNRGRFFAAKALVLTAVAFVLGQIAAFASFLLSQLVFAAKDLDASLGDPGILRAVFGAGLYLTLVPLFAFGIATILRHTAGSVTMVLGVLFVLPIIANFLPGTWGQTVQKLLPSTAGGAIMSVRPSEQLLAPWTGFGVFCLYTAILLGVAFALFRGRDA